MRVYVGFGSNQGDSIDLLRRALTDLSRLPHSAVTAVSSLYRSKPMGPVAQPDFVNAVVALETTLAPLELLRALQDIEAAHGRVRTDLRWGPRTLDLDILVYDDVVMQSDELVVPHPGIADRSFVLIPLLEIAPDLAIPGIGAVRALAARCARADLEVLPTSLTPL